MRQLPLSVLALVLLSCGVEQSTKAGYPSRVRQALSTDLVISEVYGGGGSASSAYRYDFIELFNRGSAPVSLNGKSLQYGSSTGTGSWVVTPLTTGMVQPGGYFLVRMGTPGPTSTPNLSMFDAEGTTLLSATAGKVALVSNTTPLSGACPTSANIIDLVGYGTAANCSEGMSTGNTSASSSVRRGGNGCFETDNNQADFTVGTPTPKTSSAATVNCANMPNDGGVVIMPGDGGCLVISSWPTADSSAGYQPANDIVGAELYSADTDAGFDILSLEAYFGFMPPLSIPANHTFTSGETYGSCEVCGVLSLQCDDTGTCAKEYFAVGGTANVTTATLDEGAGRFEGNMSNVRFVAWDFAADEALPSGECVVVSNATFSVAWDADAGMGGGAAGGGVAGGRAGGAGGGSAGGTASTGGGTASTGGGTSSFGGGTAGGARAGGTAGGGNLTTKKACGCSTGSEALLAQAIAGLLVLRITRRRRNR